MQHTLTHAPRKGSTVGIHGCQKHTARHARKLMNASSNELHLSSSVAMLVKTMFSPIACDTSAKNLSNSKVHRLIGRPTPMEGAFSKTRVDQRPSVCGQTFPAHLIFSCGPSRPNLAHCIETSLLQLCVLPAGSNQHSFPRCCCLHYRIVAGA